MRGEVCSEDVGRNKKDADPAQRENLDIGNLDIAQRLDRFQHFPNYQDETRLRDNAKNISRDRAERF